MLHSPHWLKGGRVVGQSWDDVPVDVRELVAEEFVVHFLGLEDLRDNLGDQVHFLHQLNPFRGRQVKQLCCMAFEYDDGPTGEELIVTEIGV